MLSVDGLSCPSGSIQHLLPFRPDKDRIIFHGLKIPALSRAGIAASSPHISEEKANIPGFPPTTPGRIFRIGYSMIRFVVPRQLRRRSGSPGSPGGRS